MSRRAPVREILLVLFALRGTRFCKLLKALELSARRSDGMFEQSLPLGSGSRWKAKMLE